MARLQVWDTLPNVVCVVPGVAYPLTSDTSLYVKSMIVQSVPTNTGDIAIGSASAQETYLTTGRSATIAGDNMDNGTSAKIQVSSIYVRGTVANEKVSISVLERL